MRALAQDATIAGVAERAPAIQSVPPNELPVLLTATIVLGIYLVALFVIGLGLIVAGQLQSWGSLAWLLAMAVPSVLVCYFWMRRFTRGRSSSEVSAPIGLQAEVKQTQRTLEAVPATRVETLAEEERTRTSPIPPTQEIDNVDTLPLRDPGDVERNGR
jgi:hypothetical protein